MAEQASQPEPGRSKRRSSRRGGPSGGAGSVLAQGEPMIWLTGGTLAVCLTMIVGLLLFIFITGFSTFWPQPIQKVTLYDGHVVMGEPFRDQTFMVPPGFADNLPDDVKAKVEAEVEANEGVAARRLLYTGNFDLNNTRNEWVDMFRIKEMQTPPWALTIERLQWGRFYGIPEKFAIMTERDVPQAEQMLDKLVKYITAHSPTSGREAAFSAEQWAEIQPQLETARKQLEDMRTKNVEAFLKSVASQGEDERMIVLRNRREKPASQVAAGDNVIEILQVWNGSEVAYEKYEQYHPTLVDAREHRHYLERDVMGDNTHRLEEKRLDVREEELDEDVQLLRSLNLISKIQIDELRPAEKRLESLRELEADVAVKHGDTAYGKAVIASIRKEQQNIQQTIIAPAKAKIAGYRDDIEDAPESAQEAVQAYLDTAIEVNDANNIVREEIAEIAEQNQRYILIMKSAQGQDKNILVADIVRAYPANQLSFGGKLSVYIGRWWEFLTADPREANMEGGVFPAIVGTVLMTMIMCILVVPFGVLAALYLREYAKAGPIISAVRISINNLAGVPSIVFGVFGLGFFIYIVGAYIDGGPQNAFGTVMPGLYWFLSLVFTAFTSVSGGVMFAMSSARKPNALLLRGTSIGGSVLLTLGAVGLLAFMVVGTHMLLLQGMALLMAVGLFALVYLGLRIGFAPRFDTAFIRKAIGWQSAGLLAVAFIGVVVLVALVPFFEGFFRVRLSENSPTFGKTALIWASFTLALLTLPVVIVATEEALSAVPNSMREGSYACGASKWQTIRRIVLPRALPGIMTGAILAMARGAGEVAPLMLVGAVKFTPELPFAFNLNPLDLFGADEQYGINRSFMHLGFHIYDVGFQSPDSEAARPMVFTTTLLLILIVFVLNISAIYLRSKLRKRFQGSAF